MGFVREPAVSGMFYPDDPETLRKDIEKYLNNADIPPVSGEIVGIIAPHAGYMYSGQVAAYGFKAITNKKADTVIVLAPSHRIHFEGIAVMEKGSYKTPLGLVRIDEESVADLVRSSAAIKPFAEAHKGEHSLEVQLPFLQSTLKDFAIVPMIMGTQTIDLCVALSDCIEDLIRNGRRQFLVVGSTDLSHYHPYTTAVKLDSVIVSHLEDFDVPGMVKDLNADKGEACGAGPMLTTMMVSDKLGARHSRVMKYANSGDVSGDRSAVVGYVSAVFYKS
ncbi:MAG TPA: AmmeMemoRadiSam system protein B [Syntrophorhabdaceae bacterium]|nr:AmmeMemoRadiSam system protein B [Syntrophorhabdaceae bacterium]HQM82036.1 AmmeMemoRadiSam system protein B [Syntrophorhabdaceae bacterium]